MIKNYLKIAWRKIKKNRFYAIINVAGLATGITSCLLIGIYILHELSYDRFHKNADRLVRVTMEYNFGDASRQVALTGTKIGPQFRREFPSVEAFARTYKRTRVVSYSNTVFAEKNFLYADSSFFRMFSFPLVEGNVSTVLNASNKVVVTQSTAKKYFGAINPVGKILRVGDSDFEITGVAADVPSNSQIQFDLVASFPSLKWALEEKWMDANAITYLLLDPRERVASLQKRVTQYMQQVSRTDLKVSPGQYLTFKLEPLTSVHLHSSLSGFEPNGSMIYIYIFTAVAILILAIACVNYVNLATAQFAGRAAEISMRKILGAEKRQIFNQFLGESFLITAVAIIAAVSASLLLLPFFDNLSGKQFHPRDFTNSSIVLVTVVLFFVVSFAAGVYPALVLSNVRLARILKPGFSFASGSGLRKSLIVLQFVISIFLVGSTIIILQQLQYIRNKDLGYDKNNIIVLPMDDQTFQKYAAIKAGLSSLPEVQHVTAAYGEPVNVQWGDNVKGENGQEITVNAIPCDEDFVKTLGLRIIAGTDFTRADLLQMDTSNDNKNLNYDFILNESAVKALGWTTEGAIGRNISRGNPGTVKAVVRDFHFRSLHEPITPLVIFLEPRQTNSIFIKIAGGSVIDALKNIAEVWKQRVTHRPFEYHFLDESYDALYQAEQRTGKIFTTFSVLAIVLACLGLFALTAFAVARRTREIGIRKVLGASSAGIVSLVAADFIKLVAVAILIASPLGWWATNKWLQDFAYRINASGLIFLGAGLATILVALLTISFQAIKAAVANPVKSLRTE